MAYCTIADIKKALPVAKLRQLTDDEKSTEVNQDRVDEAIAGADGEIDTYLGRYTVPLSSVPAIVKQCSVSIAVYNLYARKEETIPETRENRYRDAIRTLRDIRDGKMALPVPETDASGNFVSGISISSHFDTDA